MANSGGCPAGVTISVRQIADPTKRLPLGSAGSSSFGGILFVEHHFLCDRILLTSGLGSSPA
jgi:hypothetical protein